MTQKSRCMYRAAHHIRSRLCLDNTFINNKHPGQSLSQIRRAHASRVVRSGLLIQCVLLNTNT